MPKKMGINSKAEEARSRKAEAESERKDRESKDKEDRYWQELEGPKSRSSKKREEEAEKKAEILAKKAEARRLAEKEEREMEGYGKKVDKKSLRVGVGSPAVPKVTAVELERQREAEAARLAALAAETKRREMRATDEQEYEKMVAVENVNRAEDLIEARSVEAAIAQMAIPDELPMDRHPEKRARASYKAFEEVELAKLKADKPGLTHTQYKDLLWKLWKKSPDNPLNQVG
ncbi:hypothetical protein SELMODRAFT_409501 [Selaginella moellendorffii]|uniref:Coiled-coil domain-containing protein n=1 Tax=Selaginella moellendorffii TaxID=88036 RepID=D8RBN2_SELML|nr:coiled-coil domain-containing protein 124 [Selaginella moellendorffii]EFJ30822.1 hypothetical protein SELMODRAFT_409501 [Selaginella moellendorffii]|eukprot:XP_002968568.1 coiled-coil domain-containing protein 124 [Selaginella moellendorffii]